MTNHLRRCKPVQKKSVVRLNDRPDIDMTTDVYRVRKTTTQQQKHGQNRLDKLFLYTEKEKHDKNDITEAHLRNDKTKQS